MSTHVNTKRITIPQIKNKKGPGSIVALTAYSTPMAQMMDDYVDLIIVGDSVGMVTYGFNSTHKVSLEMMINHGGAVVRGTKKACIIIDMPFASYQISPKQAYKNAAKIIQQTEAQAVKLEGGLEMLETVQFLVARGIPVMPHIGMMPQYANVYGGFKAQIRTPGEMADLLDLAQKFVAAGAFALLIEGTFEQAARNVTENVTIPTIGIGASPTCDGQVLVSEDLLGLFSDYTPRFAKQYIDLSIPIKKAFSEYANEVRKGTFPANKHCFGVKKYD